MWPWRRNQPDLRDVNYLDLVPRRLVEAAADEDGRVVLLMPRYRDPVFGRLLQPRLRGARRFIRVPLEERGSWVWRQVDGQRSVGEIVHAFREAFPAESEQVEERVCHYVAALAGNGFLAVDLQEDGAALHRR